MNQKKNIRKNIHKYFLNNKKELIIGIGILNIDIVKLNKLQSKVKLNKNIKLIIISNITNNYNNIYCDCDLISIIFTDDPEKELVKLFDNNKINVIIRGNLSSSKIISLIKEKYIINSLYRIACLLKKNNTILLIAPVGIDEGKTINEKINFINYGIQLLHKIHLKIKIGIFEKNLKKRLSLYPYKIIFQNIKKKHHLKIKLFTSESFSKSYFTSNFLILPNGITGNLVFRTLSHICNLDGFGAPMKINFIKDHKKIYIDTSRSLDHYINAIEFSLFIY